MDFFTHCCKKLFDPTLRIGRQGLGALSLLLAVHLGAMAGVRLVVGICALLVAFLGLIALVNLALGGAGDLAARGAPEQTDQGGRDHDREQRREYHPRQIGEVAAQGLAVTRRLGIADDAPHVNPNGGAIALGHPLGMSGARLVTTATLELAERGGRHALAEFRRVLRLHIKESGDLKPVSATSAEPR